MKHNIFEEIENYTSHHHHHHPAKVFQVNIDDRQQTAHLREITGMTAGDLFSAIAATDEEIFDDPDDEDIEDEDLDDEDFLEEIDEDEEIEDEGDDEEMEEDESGAHFID